MKYSSTGTWERLSSSADGISAGDMNGDGRDDLLGTWGGQGVYYKDSDTGSWVKMASSATQVAAGDIDGDGTDDLLGIWPDQSGVWVKNSSDQTWEKLSSTADWIACGKMRGEGSLGTMDLSSPLGGTADGPYKMGEYEDLWKEGPGGKNFAYQEAENLIPREKESTSMERMPGPGEPGFRCVEQENLYPVEGLKTKDKKEENSK